MLREDGSPPFLQENVFDRQQQPHGRAENLIPAASDSKSRVVVFGIFDGIHEGHKDFFSKRGNMEMHLS